MRVLFSAYDCMPLSIRLHASRGVPLLLTCVTLHNVAILQAQALANLPELGLPGTVRAFRQKFPLEECH
jgi:hypothetical protein